MKQPEIISRDTRRIGSVKLADGTASLLCTYGNSTAGEQVTGDGTLQHPLRVVLTPVQAQASALFDVLRILVQRTATSDPEGIAAILKGRQLLEKIDAQS